MVAILHDHVVGLEVVRYRDPEADFVGHSVALVAAGCCCGCHMLVLAGTGAVVGVFVLAGAASDIRSCRRIRHAVASVSICRAGHSNHHPTARMPPDRGHSRNVAAGTGRCDSHIAAAAASVVAECSSVVVVVAAVSSCRSAAVGRPWRAVDDQPHVYQCG